MKENQKLLDIKRQALSTFDLENNLEKVKLEREVIEVVKKIARIDPQSTRDIDLEVDLISVKEKLPNDFIVNVFDVFDYVD